MKAVYLLTAALFSLTAQAAPPAIPNEQAPLRQARVTGTIRKYEVINRSFADPGELVCRVDAEIPVYGPIEDGKFLRNPVIADCQALAGGEPQKVHLMASVTITEARGSRPALKDLSFIFTNYGTGPDAGEFLVQMGSAASDPAARTLSLSFYATSLETAPREEKVKQFVVDLLVSDENQ
jgi:hypothetical protein